MRSIGVVAALIIALFGCATSKEVELARVRASLLPLRAAAVEGPRGAVPALTEVKRELRDWAEAYLARLPEAGDEKALTQQLNAELARARLLCDAACQRADGSWNGIGFVGRLELHRDRQEQTLVLTTALGIQCGYDESAYAYRWHEGRWRRFWSAEQDIEGDDYTPRHISRVHVSPTSDGQARLILALGYETWCSSAWSRVHFDLWRVDVGTGRDQRLLSGSHRAHVGRAPPIEGHLLDDDVILMFTDASIDPTMSFYDKVRHYVVQGSTVRRAEPVALGPRAFVEEWLYARWQNAAAWTTTPAPSALSELHARLTGEFVTGAYLEDEPQHCRDQIDLWQIGLKIWRSPRVQEAEAEEEDVYFLVRWRPPYRFQMIDAAKTPRADCEEPDPDAEVTNALFGWR